MRLLFFSALAALVLFFSSFTYSCDTIPDLNKQVVAFVKTKVKTRVGKGECWDLAAEALNSVGAKWDHDLAFGKEINLKKECVYPGDIIQFEGVEMEYRENNSVFFIDMSHHTAIVYEVKGKESFVVAEQNTANHGRKVSLDPLDFKNITKGSYKIYRPVK